MTTSNWSAILDQLHKAYDPLLNRHPDRARAADLQSWLFNRLTADTAGKPEELVHNRRVAACLAFESRTGNMPADIIFERILSRKQPDGSYFISSDNTEPAHAQFHSATSWLLPVNKVLNKDDIKHFHEFYGSYFLTAEHPTKGYARCISLPEFFRHIVMLGKDHENNSLVLEDYILLCRWKEGDLNIPIPFPEIPAENNVNMRGLKPIGWVFPSEELEMLKDADAPPVALAEKLGIPVEDPGKKDGKFDDVLVVIIYDPQFSDQIYQPAAIHANWHSGGFVCYKKNPSCYGLTFDCSRKRKKGIQERVHIVFPIITTGRGANQYRAVIFGKVNQPVKLPFESILQETLERYEALLS